jgi:hypothetical protein
MQVLSRVLSYAVDPLGWIARNPCEGVKQLYHGDRSEIIWTDSDIANLKKTCAIEIAHAFDCRPYRLEAWRPPAGVLCRILVIDAIILTTLTTGKSRHLREVIIPLYDALD